MLSHNFLIMLKAKTDTAPAVYAYGKRNIKFN